MPNTSLRANANSFITKKRKYRLLKQKTTAILMSADWNIVVTDRQTYDTSVSHGTSLPYRRRSNNIHRCRRHCVDSAGQSEGCVHGWDVFVSDCYHHTGCCCCWTSRRQLRRRSGLFERDGRQRSVSSDVDRTRHEPRLLESQTGHVLRVRGHGDGERSSECPSHRDVSHFDRSAPNVLYHDLVPVCPPQAGVIY